MHVLVAASRADCECDYSHTVEGELVHLPVVECATPDCGCRRGFGGFASHRATTTARVVDLDFDRSAYWQAMHASLVAGGWIVPRERAAPDDPDRRWLDSFVDAHLALAREFPVGTVLERLDDHIGVRFGADAP